MSETAPDAGPNRPKQLESEVTAVREVATNNRPETADLRADVRRLKASVRRLKKLISFASTIAIGIAAGLSVFGYTQWSSLPNRVKEEVDKRIPHEVQNSLAQAVNESKDAANQAKG